MSPSTTSYDFDALTKSHLAKMAAFLGNKGDWARVSKEEIITLVEQSDEADQIRALVHIGATEEDIENMRIGDGAPPVTAKDAIAAMMAAESGDVPQKFAAPPASKPAAKAPAPNVESEQVAQIAGLLASVLATNKGAIDADKVADIAREVMLSANAELTENIAEQLRMTVNTMNADKHSIMKAVEAMIADMPAKKLDVTSKIGTVTIEGRQHKQFEALLKVLGSTNSAGHSNLNVWLTGLPGTGKTHSASAAAHALGMPFYCNGSIANKYELTGFVDAHGKLVRTPFRDAWENGGLYLFDEVDGSVPSAVLAFNSALANGIMAFPDGMLKRHKDCIIIAAANTSGQGATAELVGRMKQDAAFLDRFVFMTWMLDECLESHLCQNKAWAEYVQRVRRNVESKGVKVMVTPRSTLFGDQLLAGGLDRAVVIDMTLKKGMSAAQWDMCK